MKKSYRWGILAPGKIAHKFAEGLKHAPGAELYAVASRDEKKARAFADQYNAPVSYGSYQELAYDPRVDVIYIATPHSFHMENTLLCLDGGKAVLCEKPLAMNAQQVTSMMESARINQCFLMEALWSRFLPSILKAKELAHSGALGKLHHIQADFGFKADYNPRSRMFDPDLGGGALLDIGIYPLFLALFLFGSPSQVVAEATLAPTGVDESCKVKLQFPGGQSANLYFSYAEFTPIEAHLKGDIGEIKMHSRWYQPVNLTVVDGQGAREITVDYTGNGYNYQAVEVMNCLEQGRTESPNWPLSASLELMNLMDEIRRQCHIKYAVDQV